MVDVAWVLALGFVAWAGWLDWKSRRIPNWLTVPALILGVGVNALGSGWLGFRAALAGAALMLLLLLPLVWLRALGAGDWKLMGALGGMLGPHWALAVLFWSLMIGGLMAGTQVIRHKKVKQTATNLGALVQGFFVFGLRPHPVIALGNPEMMSLPFGVAVAGATLLCFGVGVALARF